MPGSQHTTVSTAAPATVATQNALPLEKIDASCPMIYDNDWWTDIPDDAYIWAKASLQQCDLRGNIITRDMWGCPGPLQFSHEECIKQCTELLAQARASGLRNIPDPVIGAAEPLRKPESGRMEDTPWVKSAGSELIVREAHRATPEKPLLVFCGGPCTTLATAYLTDPQIIDRIIVFQIDGGAYNGKDSWAFEIARTRCRFINWAKGYFWDKVATWSPEHFAKLPANPLGDALRTYANADIGKANQWGDGAPIFWVFNHACWTKTEPYDAGSTAITVPIDGNNVPAMADEFFKTMMNAKVYR